MFFSFLRSRGGSARTRLIEHEHWPESSKRTLERADDERRCRRHNGDLGLTVLDGELHGDAQALPRGGRFCDIFTDLFGRLKTTDEILRHCFQDRAHAQDQEDRFSVQGQTKRRLHRRSLGDR